MNSIDEHTKPKRIHSGKTSMFRILRNAHYLEMESKLNTDNILDL